MKFSLFHQALCLLFTASVVLGQGWVDQQQDYYGEEEYYAQEGDSLYHDYAAHQEKKAQGGNGYVLFNRKILKDGIILLISRFFIGLNNVF